MDLVEATDKWSLAALKCEITRVCLDYAIELLVVEVEETCIVRIEQAVQLRHPHGSTLEIDPEGEPHDLAPILRVLRAEVTRLDAFKDGHLEIETSDGTLLSVAPGDDFEAWEISAPNDFRLVSTPGGRVSAWTANGLPHDE